MVEILLRLIVASSDRNPILKKSHNCLRGRLHRAQFQTFGANAKAESERVQSWK